MKFVPPKKIRIFNYKKISCQLILETKGLEVTLLQDHFDTELLFELESMLTWCLSHTEVKYVLFNSKNNLFSCGFNYEEFQNLSKNKIIKLYQKLHNINETLKALPQTTICHFQNGALNEAITFALSCDLKFANDSADNFQFNFLDNGLIDASGLLSSLYKVYPDFIRTYVLTGISFGIDSLKSNQINVLSAEMLSTICASIAKQSSISRVQAKCAMMPEKNESQNSKKQMFELLSATLEVEDFKRVGEFKNLRELKEELSSNLN